MRVAIFRHRKTGVPNAPRDDPSGGGEAISPDEVHSDPDVALSALSSDSGATALPGHPPVLVAVYPADYSDSKQRADGLSAELLLPFLRSCRADRALRQVFIVVCLRAVSEDAKLRLSVFAAGSNMIADREDDVQDALRLVYEQLFSGFGSLGEGGSTAEGVALFACPECGLANLTEDALHGHFPLYHAMERTRRGQDCPVCGLSASQLSEPFAVHLHNRHGPLDAREPAFPRFAAFAWVCVRRPSDGKFLLVHEPAGICASGTPAFWFPAGRVDAGESVVEAGIREALEEAGVRVRITGVLLVMLDGGGVVPRVVLLGEPEEQEEEGRDGRNHSVPKALPDFESCGAAWLDVAQLEQLGPGDFRGAHTAELYASVARGELRPQQLDKPSFRAFEDTIRRLTSENEAHSGEDERDEVSRWGREMEQCRTRLCDEYPSEMVVMEGLESVFR
jgi:8-oxo-dGTP pyrophosphatase MutT (NUDIX family)